MCTNAYYCTLLCIAVSYLNKNLVNEILTLHFCCKQNHRNSTLSFETGTHPLANHSIQFLIWNFRLTAVAEFISSASLPFITSFQRFNWMNSCATYNASPPPSCSISRELSDWLTAKARAMQIEWQNCYTILQLAQFPLFFFPFYILSSRKCILEKQRGMNIFKWFLRPKL